MCRLGKSHANGDHGIRNNLAINGKRTNAKSVVRLLLLLMTMLVFAGFKPDAFAAPSATATNEDGYFCRIDDIIARPTGAERHQFVLISLGIEVKKRADVDVLRRKEQRVRQIAERLIAQRHIKDLSAPNGKRSLRYALHGRIGDLLPSGSLSHIYFTDYVVQTRR